MERCGSYNSNPFEQKSQETNSIKQYSVFLQTNSIVVLVSIYCCLSYCELLLHVAVDGATHMNNKQE